MRDSRTRQAPGSPDDPAANRDAALHALGLEPGSPLDDAAVTHDALVRFLATAPRSIHGWAHAQAETVDAAYARLTDTVTTVAAGPDALVGGAATVATRPGEPDRLPARRVTPPPVQAPTALSEEDRIEELLASVTPSHHRDSVVGGGPTATTAAPAPAAKVPGTVTLKVPGRRFLAAAGLVLAIGAVAVVGYGFNGGTGAPADASSGTGAATDGTQTGSATIDQAKIAALMTRIAADPNDADALLGIGDEYYTIGDYTTAVDWFRKASAADPANVKAVLALGAAQWNNGDTDGAEIQWTHAVELDPANVEAHYDLGFLYLNREPADMDGVRREWNEVIRLAPGSDIAQTVQTHLTALESPAPGASGAPVASTVPAASTAPVASVAPAAAESPRP